MISDTDWTTWITRHATTFGMNDAELDMLDAWREPFELRGYTVAELLEATTWLAANDPPQWRSEHLARLRKRIEASRFARYRAEQAEIAADDERDLCRECRGAGLVVVPHLNFVRDGRWIPPWYTYAVACNCRRGLRIYEQCRAAAAENDKRRAIVSIGDYEMVNPRWREQVEQKRQAQAADVRAESAAKAGDTAFGSLVRKILTRAKPKAIEAKP